jgi:peptidylprolyl isomerase
MISKFETIGIAASILCMAFALFLLNRTSDGAYTAAPTTANQAAVIVVSDEPSDSNEQARAQALVGAIDEQGQLDRVVVDDVIIGGGQELAVGDNAVVHYIGRLQNGQEFDNSYNRGTTFSFELGAGEVISGWDSGLVGMKVGGQRILVIPPSEAYGARGAGPIPPNATLVFAVELLGIE